MRMPRLGKQESRRPGADAGHCARKSLHRATASTVTGDVGLAVEEWDGYGVGFRELAFWELAAAPRSLEVVNS
jgi:hypothetical protein